MQDIVATLISIYNKAKSLEEVSVTEAFKAYDDALQLINDNNLIEPKDIIKKCKHGYLKMYNQTIGKPAVQNELRQTLDYVKQLNESPRTIKALCKLYIMLIANAYYTGQHKSDQAKQDINAAELLLQKVTIDTEYSVKLRKLLEEIKPKPTR